MRRPSIVDFVAIIDTVRRTGSVHYRKAAVPGEFTDWRRRVRQAARAGNVSVRVTRSRDFVVVESRDWRPSEDDDLATADVIEGALTGRSVSFEAALAARRRQRLRVVRPAGTGEGDDG